MEDKEEQARPKKKNGAPKKPISPYMFFCAEERERGGIPGKPREQARELGARWRALVDKNKYIDLAKEDKTRYEAEKAALDGKEQDDEQGNEGEEAVANFNHDLDSDEIEEGGEPAVPNVKAFDCVTQPRRERMFKLYAVMQE